MNEPQAILNVDDYAPGRYARTKVLRQAGFPVIEASGGEEALSLVTERKPSLVLLDVNMPGINGIEVCQRIKNDPKTASITVVHISASNVQTQHLVYGLNSGADGYLVEPIDPSVLVATVRALLRARQAEDALRRSNEDLETFAYTVAHDLNEPLRTVMAHVQLLERRLKGQLDESTSEHVQFVVEGAARMRSLIDAMLIYSQATNGAVESGPLDCAVMLERIKANLDASIRDTGARITSDSLPVLTADVRLEQVFQNLVSNALKYRKPDVAPEVHIGARADQQGWLFSVQDNGIGIRPAYTERIFHLFRRLHGREVPGNGIGLTLSQKIVERHGGRLWVESEPDAGSTFYFNIPRSRKD